MRSSCLTRRFCYSLSVALAAAAALVVVSASELAAAEWQTADDIRTQLIGNGAKLTGTDDDGVRWRERYEDDGKIVGRWKNWKYWGKWWFEGDMMCFDYKDGDEEDGCWYLAIDGDTTKWWTADGEPDDSGGDTTYVVP